MCYKARMASQMTISPIPRKEWWNTLGFFIKKISQIREWINDSDLFLRDISPYRFFKEAWEQIVPPQRFLAEERSPNIWRRSNCSSIWSEFKRIPPIHLNNSPDFIVYFQQEKMGERSLNFQGSGVASIPIWRIEGLEILD